MGVIAIDPRTTAPVGENAADLRVTHLSATDVVGGAGLAATRLHDGLRRSGIDSRMVVVMRRSDDAGIIPIRPFPWLPAYPARQIFRALRRIQNLRRSTYGGPFSPNRVYYGGSLPKQVPLSDIIHLHWVIDLVDFRTVLPKLARRAPLVWTFHDMNAFTGGCHYNGACERFTSMCGACPQLDSHREHDLSHAVFREKQRALSRIPSSRLIVLAPSRWMARESERSALFGRFRTVTIPNGVDTERFTPGDRLAARRELGLPENAKIVLFVADYVSDQRKGFPVLLKALEQMRSEPDLFILTLGAQATALPNIPNRSLGRINDPLVLASAYRAADLFVVPSLQDNLPNTVLEAMSSGLPVIGFRAGGIPDMIVDGETGRLADSGDSSELARAISQLLGTPGRRRAMGHAARRRALEEFSLERQATACRALYFEHIAAQSGAIHR
jgi:glycosyltransferase involved in cell wall biosynthesis